MPARRVFRLLLSPSVPKHQQWDLHGSWVCPWISLNQVISLLGHTHLVHVGINKHASPRPLGAFQQGALILLRIVSEARWWEYEDMVKTTWRQPISQEPLEMEHVHHMGFEWIWYAVLIYHIHPYALNDFLVPPGKRPANHQGNLTRPWYSDVPRNRQSQLVARGWWAAANRRPTRSTHERFESTWNLCFRHFIMSIIHVRHVPDKNVARMPDIVSQFLCKYCRGYAQACARTNMRSSKSNKRKERK